MPRAEALRLRRPRPVRPPRAPGAGPDHRAGPPTDGLDRGRRSLLPGRLGLSHLQARSHAASHSYLAARAVSRTVPARRKLLANEAGGKRRTHVAWRQVREQRLVSIAQNDLLGGGGRADSPIGG